MKKFLSLLITLISSSTAGLLAQSVGDFQSAGSGNWNATSTWQTWNGSGWISASSTPTSADGVISILDGHTITIPSGFSVSVDQLYVGTSSTAELIIASGGAITAVGTGNDIAIYNDGLSNSTLTVSGTLTVNQNGSVVEFDGFAYNPTSSTTLTFNSGGLYQHNYTSGPGKIPYANWQSGSTCSVIGYTTNTGVPTGLDQSFYHFLWNCTAATGTTISLGLTGTTSFNGNFTVSSTNGKNLVLGGSSTSTINISGDFIVQNNSKVFFNSSGTGNTFNISGNLTNSSTSLVSLTNAGTVVVNVAGNFSSTGSGGFNLNNLGSGTSTLSVKGNFTVSGGTFGRIAGSGVTSIVFNGTSTQTFFNSGVIASVAINYSISNGAIVDCGASIFPGTGTFTCNATGIIKTANTSGISNSTPSGTVQTTSTRTFTGGATIIYNGNSNQNLGDAFPTDVNFTINNSSGVTMNGNLTMNTNRALNLQSGTLTISANTLTINGSLTSTSGNIGADNTSSLVIGGTGALGTIPFSGTTTQIGNFTLGRTTSGSATLGSDIEITDAMTLTDGNFIISDRTLTLSGTASISGTGNLYGNSSTTITINGTGSLGTLSFASGGNSIGTLTMTRTSSGAATIGSNLTIGSDLFLSNGALTTASVLTMATASNITRTSGTISATPSAQTSYNVKYLAALTTGPELPSLSTALNNLTIDPTSGTIVLNSSTTVNGSLYLNTGTLNNGTTNVTMASGSTIQRSAGATIAATPSGTNWNLVYAGSVTTGPEAPSSGTALNNLTINSTFTVTASANISLNGNLTNNGTFTASTYTITFTGTSKSISGNDCNFNNLTLGTSATISLGSDQSIVGTLTLGTSSKFTTTGHTFTLISNNSGTARIATIPSGASITGNVTAQRYIPGTSGRYWYQLASPVSNATVSQWQTGAPTTGFYITGPFTGASNPGNGISSTGISMYTYNAGTGVFSNYPSSSNTQLLTPKVGFRAFIRDGSASTAPNTSAKTISVTGTPNTGIQNFSLSYNSAGGNPPGGWNFLGNPFASDITADLNNSGWAKSGLAQNTVYIWDADAQTYVSCNGGTGNCTIPSSQGFWVQVSSGGGSLSATENVKVSGSTTIYKLAASSDLLVVNLTHSSSNISNNTYFRIDPQSTLGFDGDYDAYKLDNVPGFGTSPGAISLASKLNDIYYSINSVPALSQSDTIPLYVVSRDGNNILDFSNQSFAADVNLYLLDRYTGSVTDLKASPKYNFNVSSTDSTTQYGRFKIVLSKTSVATSVVDQVENDITFQIYPNPAENKKTKLALKSVLGESADIEIKDLAGKTVFYNTYSLTSGSLEENINLTNFVSGIYTVFCKTRNGIYTQKLIIE